MKTQIKIERLTRVSVEDTEAVRQLASQFGHDNKPLTDEDMQDIIASSNTYFFVVRDIESKQIVGMAMLLIYRTPYTKKAVLEEIIVDEKFRGQGIGALLIEKVLTKAKEKHATYLYFTSNPQRVAANKFYEKLGFQKRETNVYQFVFDYGEV